MKVVVRKPVKDILLGAEVGGGGARGWVASGAAARWGGKWKENKYINLGI